MLGRTRGEEFLEPLRMPMLATPCLTDNKSKQEEKFGVSHLRYCQSGVERNSSAFLNSKNLPCSPKPRLVDVNA